MDEARRFLRYVMPGIVYGVQTLLWLFIVFPDWTMSQLSKLQGKDFLAAIGAFLASGALGYIFAAVHHRWIWLFDSAPLDHRKVVMFLDEKGLIPEQLVSGPLDHKKIDRKMAEIVSWSLWYPLVGKDRRIDEITAARLTTFGDNAHGLGAARVASVFALFTTLLFCVYIGTFQLTPEPVLRFVLMLILSFGSIYIFGNCYHRVANAAQGIYDNVLAQSLSTPNSQESERHWPRPHRRRRCGLD